MAEGSDTPAEYCQAAHHQPICYLNRNEIRVDGPLRCECHADTSGDVGDEEQVPLPDFVTKYPAQNGPHYPANRGKDQHYQPQDALTLIHYFFSPRTEFFSDPVIRIDKGQPAVLTLLARLRLGQGAGAYYARCV
jgi:hypothetical protein